MVSLPFSPDEVLSVSLLCLVLQQGYPLLRRERDSNPRNAFDVYTLSRRASSATRASLHIYVISSPTAIYPSRTARYGPLSEPLDHSLIVQIYLNSSNHTKKLALLAKKVCHPPYSPYGSAVTGAKLNILRELTKS